MSMIKQRLYEETEAPTCEDMVEYELYCYYTDMVERYNTTAPIEFLEEAFGEEVEKWSGMYIYGWERIKRPTMLERGKDIEREWNIIIKTIISTRRR